MAWILAGSDLLLSIYGRTLCMFCHVWLSSLVANHVEQEVADDIALVELQYVNKAVLFDCQCQ